jgi:hypothetical protein
MSRNVRRGLLAWGVLLLTLAGIDAHACNTPVYRYAMYNWPPAPYRVYWIGEGPAAEKDERAQQLRQATETNETKKEAANLEVIDVDASQAKQLDGLPEPVQAAWQARDKKSRSLQVIITPWNATLFAGQLEAKQIAPLLQSPLRKRIGELLGAGHATLFLVVAAPSAQRTKQAEEAVDRVIAQANAGEIDVPTQDPAGEPPAGDPNGDAKPGTAQRPRLARLTVDRKDAAEDWLLKPLLAVEEDIKAFADQPMVFPVYGRGRVLPPFVGKGITVENLTECVSFVAGACSCMVKDQNPGVDLLMTWDWETASQRLAAEDEQSDGGQMGYRESAAGPAAAGQPQEGASQSGVSRAQLVSSGIPAAPSGVQTIAVAPALTPSGGNATAAAQPTSSPSIVLTTTRTVSVGNVHITDINVELSPFLQNQLRVYAVAIGVGALVVFLMGYFWIRQKTRSEPRLP